jgi:hypothetical protein
VRAVHLERTGSVGNNSVIDMRAIMGPQNDGVEDSRHIHLDANSTIVYPCGMEHGAKAAIYLNGVADVIYAPSFGNPAPVAPNNVFLRVGPKAQECVIYAPSTTSWPDAGTNVYDAPETWNWRGLNQLYKVVVYSPSKRLEHTVFKPHPRLKVVSEYAPVDEQSRDGELSASGESVSRVFTSAFHLENLTPIFNNDSRGVSGVSADADAYEGYRFELPASNGGALATLKFGRDFKNGHLIRCRARYKLAASPSSGNCSSVVLKNGGSFVASGATGNHTSYQTIDLVTYTVSGFIAGDELGVGFDNGANQAVHVSSILVEVLEPPSVTGSRGANAALASLLTQLASRGIVIDNTTA